MRHLVRGELWVQGELLEVSRDELGHPLHVPWLHRPHAGQLRCLGNLVELDCPGHGHPRAKVRETHLDQLLRVQRPVVVAALTDRSRQDYTSCVDRLPDVLLVHPPCDLLDQHRCQALRPQFLVHAEEVDLHHADHWVVDLHACRNASDEAHELAAGLHPHAQVPASQIAWWLQGPPEETDRVVEAEHAVIILDVVLAQKQVDLLCLHVVVDVASAPLELVGQWVRLVTDLLRVLDVVDWPTILCILSLHRGHRLRVPKGVRPFHVPPGLLADARSAQNLQQLLLAAQAITLVLVLLLKLLLGKSRG
mmetsp:Transcript_82764/g.192306  ORF Transcript_82764/g.192306 Transcript_82764/m.192306 type:complete len:307 (-) Transcript_82764:282-1202(-)